MGNDIKKYDFNKDFAALAEKSRKINEIDPADFLRYGVKRGLRNADGTGVLAGITRVCDVHGYVVKAGDKLPQDGRLVYRGIEIENLVNGLQKENRFGFEETAWLILFGSLPTGSQLEAFRAKIAAERELPASFLDNCIFNAPSQNIMNSLQRATLSLYNYDDKPEDQSLENSLTQSMSLIAKMPSMMTAAYQVKRRIFDNKSMHFHQPDSNLSTAENIMRTLRSDKQFTDDEAKILDLCLVLHADHGGGNNSTFTTRVVTSTGTDTYSAISAGIGSLKGPRHGGANKQVMDMMDDIKANLSNWSDENEIRSYLKKIINKEAGDRSGLIYGMGHAVYTVSDPRAILLKEYAEKMVGNTDFEAEYLLMKKVEEISPSVFNEKKGNHVPLCANVDFYSGLVYTMLGIPPELMTPLFAVSRTVGWCAHRMEEMLSTGGKIIRPAYKVIAPSTDYVPLDLR